MLQLEIQPYLDKDGLVSPTAGGGSNNQVMYTCEYLIALIRSGSYTSKDTADFLAKMKACMKTPGLLMRHPDGTGGQEGPDDYIGLAAALDEIGSDAARAMAMEVVTYGIEHLGCFNNENPGTFTGSAELIRQPQLDAAFLWAAGLPVSKYLVLYVAGTIALAGIGSSGTDPWILSWLLVQIAGRHSFLCKLAAKFWRWRLLRKFPNGMKDVFGIYFSPNHPLALYAPSL